MIQPSLSWHLSRENHNLKRYMYPSVHCNTIYNSQDKEATYMSINWGMDKDVVHIWRIIRPQKTNEIMPFAASWMDLEIIILSEVSQTVNHKHHMVSLVCGILKKKKRIQMNLFAEQKETDRLWKTWLPKETGLGGSGLGGLGLTYVPSGIWNDWPPGTCCIAQSTLLNILW